MCVLLTHTAPAPQLRMPCTLWVQGEAELLETRVTSVSSNSQISQTFQQHQLLQGKLLLNLSCRNVSSGHSAQI